MGAIEFLGIVPLSVRRQAWSEADAMIANRPGIPGTRSTITSRHVGDHEQKRTGAMGEIMMAEFFGMSRRGLERGTDREPDLDDWLEIKTSLACNRTAWDKAHSSGNLHLYVDDYSVSKDHFAVAQVFIYEESYGTWLIGWIDAPTVRGYPLDRKTGHQHRHVIPLLDIREPRSLPLVTWPA